MLQQTSKPIDASAAEEFDRAWQEFNQRHHDETPPPSAISAGEYSERFNMSRQRAYSLLRSAEQRGELKSRLFVRHTGHDYRPVRYWWKA